MVLGRPRQAKLGSSLMSCFLISGLSYKTTFNSELRISSFPLYWIWPNLLGTYS